MAEFKEFAEALLDQISVEINEEKEMDKSLVVEMKKRLDLTDKEFSDIMSNEKKNYWEVKP